MLHLVSLPVFSPHQTGDDPVTYEHLTREQEAQAPALRDIREFMIANSRTPNAGELLELALSSGDATEDQKAMFRGALSCA
jgi:hypothetical protein